MSQYEIMKAIKETQGLTIRELTKILNISKSSVSVNIRKLVKSGYLIKKRINLHECYKYYPKANKEGIN